MFENLLFDWSGTLVDDLPIVLDATNRVLGHYESHPLTRDEFRARFRLPYAEFYEEALPGVDMEELEDHFRHHFDRSEEKVVILPHAREFLELCMDRGTRCFILSSMDALAFDAQAKALGLDGYFEHCYAGVRDKREQIHQILETHELDPAHTAFIGDMQHDVDTAHHAGVTAIALLTGYNDAAQLAKSSPQIMTPDLLALRDLISRSHAGVNRPISTVGALLHRGDQVLLVKTHKWNHSWGIPGGKIRRSESSEDALRREMREETGLEIKSPHFVCVQDCIDSEEFIRPAHFLLLNYLAEAEPGEVTLNEEAEEFQWLPIKDSLALNLNQATRYLIERILEQGLLG